MSKETIVNALSEWKEIDSTLEKLSIQSKELRQRKKVLTESLVGVMKKNEIDCFDLKDSKIIYTKNNTKTTINKEYVMNCLTKYFKIKRMSVNVEEICEYIFSNREVVTKDNLRIKLNKTN
mgnify:CR=1 FL=1